MGVRICILYNQPYHAGTLLRINLLTCRYIDKTHGFFEKIDLVLVFSKYRLLLFGETVDSEYLNMIIDSLKYAVSIL